MHPAPPRTPTHHRRASTLPSLTGTDAAPQQSPAALVGRTGASPVRSLPPAELLCSVVCRARADAFVHLRRARSTDAASVREAFEDALLASGENKRLKRLICQQNIDLYD
jgi:hypothetical protein